MGSLVNFEEGSNSAEQVFSDCDWDGVLSPQFQLAHEGLHSDSFDALLPDEIWVLRGVPLQ